MGPNDQTSDSELLARAPDDVAALEQLYRRYVRRVAAFAARRATSPDDVADVVAQTFDRLLRSAHRYDPARGPVAAFVFAIASSEVADHYRRAARHQAVVARLAGRDLLDHDDVARIEAALDARSSIAALAEALDDLPESQGEVLRLVAAGLTPAEAADRLGITPNAARVRLAKARRHLRPEASPPGGPTP